MQRPFNPPPWPARDTESVRECPVCGGTERTLLHAGLVDDTFFTAPGHWTLQRCRDCRSAYLDPRPTPDALPAAYAAYYTHGGAAQTGGGGIKATGKRLLKSLSDAYVATLSTPAAEISWRTRLKATVVRAVPPCRQVVDARFRHLRRPLPGRDRLLDVGCGGGEFMLRARQLGWRVEGVDFDPKAVAQARAQGLDGRVGSIDAYAAVSERFDVVTCNHVIEHVYHPADLVAAIHRLLKPGGRLWIETPNIDSTGHALFGPAWRGLEAPRHITVLGYQALVRLLQQRGFTVTHGTPFNFQHIRQMFACGEAMRAHGDPHNTVTPLLPNRHLLRGLFSEAVSVRRREFVCLRAIKTAA